MGYMRFAAEGGAICAPAAISEATLAWSDPATWGGSFPTAQDIVRVPAGRCLLIDQDIEVAALEIAGTVRFAERDLTVRAGAILVTGPGVLRAGDTETPFAHRLNITLTGQATQDFVDGLGHKFLAAIDGGSIELYGPRRKAWTVLFDTAAPAALDLRLCEPVDWRAGDRIAIASGGPDLPLVEERVVTAVSVDGLRVSLNEGLQHRHLGQHGRVRGALPGAIGKVALLNRAIVIEGDELSADGGIGAHCMIAGHAPGEPDPSRALPSTGRFVGVEFRRVGQFNRVARYPIYWYANAGRTEGCLVDCVINESYQRGVVLHSSPGVRLSGNVVFKPLGHGFIVDQRENAAGLLATNLTIRPRRVRFADPVMRDSYERHPRGVWFDESAQRRAAATALN